VRTMLPFHGLTPAPGFATIAAMTDARAAPYPPSPHGSATANNKSFNIERKNGAMFDGYGQVVIVTVIGGLMV
jgi:hypothetical protein